MTASQLAAVVGILISLAANYIPGFADWYAAKDSTTKRLIMLGLMLVIVIVIFVFACAKIFSDITQGVTCDQQGAVQLIEVFIAAVIANQAAYLITPTPRRIQQIIARRK